MTLPAPSQTTVPLKVSSGAPIRVYLTQRLTKKLGEPVHAKVIEPIFAYDREVVPAGAEVIGSVTKLIPVSKIKRFSAIINGDFTPLHQADVQFTTLLLPDGRKVALETAPTIGLTSIYSPPKPGKEKGKGKAAKSPSPNGGILGTGKAQIQGQINSRTRGVADLVRGPDKRERLEDLLINKLPYHPQWVRKGTRFDAELRQPVSFGDAQIDPASLALLGSQPPSDSVVHARLITPLDSASCQQSQRVEAIISQPLFSPDHKLILPEGTHVIGAVTLAHPARSFHRSGQLRFAFQSIDLPGTVERKTLGVLDAAESSGKTPVKVDTEGGVKADEPKTRLLAPALAAIFAMKSLDNDQGRRKGDVENNGGGRTLAGASGFGLLGALAAQSSRTVGSVLGFYGMGWSLYTNVIAPGPEIEFSNNAAVDIRFGSRPAAAPLNSGR